MPGWSSPPRKGDIFRNPLLAETLKTIAASGRDAFYRGPTSPSASTPSAVSQRLLPAEAQIWPRTRPRGSSRYRTNYRGYDVWELPPNGQGIAALQMLNILEGYDLRRHGSLQFAA
jgi:gamma-glutamyltranspeptidase/glutathione hydrolase